MYVICDHENKVIHMGVKMWGKHVEVLGFFAKEDEALDLLFQMEEKGVLKNHQVVDVGEGFVVEYNPMKEA
jgi:hypothetical protein